MSSTKADVWIPIYVGDYLADTTRLTTAQHGAYFLLILDYWRNGPPPDNDAILAQITRCSEHDWSMHRAALEQYFTVDDGVWRHGRIDRELEAASQKKTAAVSKAKAAATARWSRGEQAPSDAPSIPPGTTQAQLEQCPSPSPSPSEKSQEQAGKPAAPSRKVSLTTHLKQVKDADGKFLPDDDPIYDYAAQVGITTDMLRIAFLKFKERYADEDKRYSDWRRVFRRSVKDRWYKLWYLDDASGQVQLTTDGKLAMEQFRGDGALRRAA